MKENLHELEVPKKYHIKKTDKETLAKWFYLMTVGRAIDEKAPNYLKQAIGWSYHAPYAGHDGIQLAIGQVFDKETDHLFPYYRDMLTNLSAGMTSEELILNGISKATDVTSGGRHMSNHFGKPEWNIHNVSSCTGNHTLHAVGVGRAMRYYKHKGVSISSQGESSVSEGYVYEAINGASNEQLPVIFVLQDNGYGISVPKRDQTANRKVANNFTGFKNLRIIHCNGKDVFDSMNAMAEAKAWSIENQMPVIVQANCVRIHSHSNSDRHELYRNDYELNYVSEYDPLGKFRRMLLRYNRFTEDELDELTNKALQEVKDVHKKALKAPDPDPESIFDFVLPEPYVSENYPDGTHNEDGDKKKLIEALNGTLKEEFRRNPDTFIWGQDMANKDKGGIFNVSKGMQQEFGIERVFNGPIAEDYITGTANGMSRFKEDIRIVVEGAEFADYFWPAMEQFVEMTHEYWRTNGKFSPNVTIRLASGGYIGGGLYHSQTIEGALSTFPGIRIVYPSFADDAAGLLRTSIRSKGPTLFLEPKALYNSPIAATPIPEEFEVPFGRARVRKEGSDLTVITYGNTTHMCLNAANKLEEEGYSVEVIDLRSLIPLDKETILESVKKTNKAIVVHEDKVFAGFGGEIAATITSEAFEYLDGPVQRVGSTFTPVGFNRILEKAILPNDDKVYDAMAKLLKY
ncbi:alpha-ketoacid dehydrogenase subunit alpha/beta [Prolixibacter denitrificans]|uniref:3-methyl-2-oxobutanoate dehydrogenase (2-methylpropanoyl-transferring) n=1 Tax=Prolixibacter denitrificans TaxID=1541063 RepID=A0A2P8CAG9_9BACT|nr:alpha-ketoacid dehydrogenase subunit alpha/beta [Prolixibacter denitrificans]PSK81957.1 2-oxoisovalerate dehydrogenase E1 component [Prolixibacter denitrificans]GET22554.1 2-oxoisovalerate dehydrogenase subunit beta [Prolixibacter denitrificans]